MEEEDICTHPKGTRSLLDFELLKETMPHNFGCGNLPTCRNLNKRLNLKKGSHDYPILLKPVKIYEVKNCKWTLKLFA